LLHVCALPAPSDHLVAHLGSPQGLAVAMTLAGRAKCNQCLLHMCALPAPSDHLNAHLGSPQGLAVAMTLAGRAK